MKIAIVCDWLVHPGGAEKVLAQLLKCYPNADLFSLIDFLPETERQFLHDKPVKTSFMQHIPFVKKYYRQLISLMPIVIEQFDLSEYNLIISTSHAVAKGVLTGPDQCHICYIYSPMRYAWDLQHQYLKNKSWLARYLLHKLRIWDYRSAAGVDHFIAISDYIAKRVKKTYRREAAVIHPPVDLSRFTPVETKEEFYLTASRFVPYKKIDLIVDTFNHLPDKKLIVIGDGPEFKKIKRKASANVTLLGFQPDHVLISYLQRARAFIFAAEEDFGIVPLEAQACGTPVIAFGKGGALETIRDLAKENPTGVFFMEQTVPALVEAIERFEETEHLMTNESCVKNAAQFNKDIFTEKFKKMVDDIMEQTS